MMGKLKVVTLDSRARVRNLLKDLAQDLAKPGIRHFSYVIQRDETWCIRGTHTDTLHTSDMLQYAANIMKTP